MFKDRFKEVRTAHKMTQRDAAQLFHVSNGTIGNWEAGNRIPDTEMLSQIADYFEVTVDYLLGRDEKPDTVNFSAIPGLYPIQKKKFPVLGNVACGEPVFAEENRDAFLMASADIDADFCLIADGDSMNGAHIEDGDIVFVKQMEIVPNGYIAVVLIDDEATLKYIDYPAGSVHAAPPPCKPCLPHTSLYRRGAEPDPHPRHGGHAA